MEKNDRDPKPHTPEKNTPPIGGNLVLYLLALGIGTLLLVNLWSAQTRVEIGYMDLIRLIEQGAARTNPNASISVSQGSEGKQVTFRYSNLSDLKVGPKKITGRVNWEITQPPGKVTEPRKEAFCTYRYGLEDDNNYLFDLLKEKGFEGVRAERAPSGWLPAPLHLAPALMRLGYLTLGERWAVGRAMLRLARAKVGNPETEETIGGWLRRQGQSERSIELFWSVILVGALSDPLDRISLSAARKVFVDGFLAARTAYELEVPKTRLGEIQGRVAARLAERDVAIHLGTPVGQIDGDGRRATGVMLCDGRRREFDFVVVAVPWGRVRSLFPDVMLAAIPALQRAKRILPATITTMHLWFDRPITTLPHAVLVGRLGQWVFNHGPRSVSPDASEPGYYYQVVINALREPAGRRREEVVAEVRGDLEAVWPQAREARLLRWRLVSRPEAVFSCRPGLERFRPAQQTPIENLMLAGDWTATGWPATMEGAVRSGYLAVEAVLRSLGHSKRLLVPDLPRERLARLLFGPSDNTA